MKNTKDYICYHCYRWREKAPGDYASGRCRLTGCETPPRYGCGWWIDHEGAVSVAEQLERKQRALEAERLRMEEEERRRLAERARLAEQQRQRAELSERTKRRVQTCWKRCSQMIWSIDQCVAFVSARTGVKEYNVRKIIENEDNI